MFIFVDVFVDVVVFVWMEYGYGCFVWFLGCVDQRRTGYNGLSGIFCEALHLAGKELDGGQVFMAGRAASRSSEPDFYG